MATERRKRRKLRDAPSPGHRGAAGGGAESPAMSLSEYRELVRKATRYTDHMARGYQQYAKLGASLDDVDPSALEAAADRDAH